MTELAAVLLAGAAAALFGVSSALQHAASTRAERRPPLHPGLLGQLVRDRLWLSGAACDAAAVLAQAWALLRAPVTVVQPVLVLGLPFAILLRDAIGRVRPSATLLGWCLVCAASVSVFVLSTEPVDGSAAPSQVGLVAMYLNAGVACGAAVWARSSRHAGVVSATAAGALLGLASVGLKALLSGGGWRSVSTLSSELLLVVLTGSLGLLVSQWAFQQGPLAIPLAAITVVEPLVAVVGATAFLGERLHISPIGIVAAVAASLGCVASVVALARCQAPPANDAFRPTQA